MLGVNPEVETSRPLTDWELCYSTTIGSFGLNDSNSDSFTSVTYITPDSPSSITASRIGGEHAEFSEALWVIM